MIRGERKTNKLRETGTDVNRADHRKIHISVHCVDLMFMVCSKRVPPVGTAEFHVAPYREPVASETFEDMEDGLMDAGFLVREATEPLLFENGEWAVTDAGLEHKRTGYFIERADFARKRPDHLWACPLHMLEKNWCAPQLFADAFLRAALAYGVEPDPDLDLSFLAAARARAEHGMWDRMAREFGLRERAPEPVRLGELAQIGAEICRRRAYGRGTTARGGAERPGESAEKLRRRG